MKIWIHHGRRVTWVPGIGEVLYVRVLLGVTDPKMHVHHKDENPLNDSRENLEVLTSAEHTLRHHAGVRASNETRQKMSVAKMGNQNLLGHRHSEETRRKMSASHMGNTALLGHKHSDETRRKMSESHKARNQALREEQACRIQKT